MYSCGQTLNLTAALERLIADIVRRMAEFAHIETARLMVCVSTTRNGGACGTYAKIHPLRFAGGSRTMTARRGRRTFTCTMPAITHRGAEMLYVIYFLVPRFLNLPLREKLVTIFHELFHISPAFDGDIRRFPGRNYAHGSSTKKFNNAMATLVDEYLGLVDDEGMLSFLAVGMDELRSRHPAIVGRKFPAPKVIVTPH
jgi:hypothetical protein